MFTVRKNKMTQLNEAIRQKDFGKATSLVLRFLRKKIGNKVYMYPTPERFIPSGGSEMVGIRFFFGGNKSIRFNWKKSIDSSSGLLSMDYWDGSKIPQPNPSQHIMFDEQQSLAKVLPFVVEFIEGTVEKKGIYVTEEVSSEFNLVLDFRTDLNEATYTSGELSKTVTNIINALKANVQLGDQYKAGGNKKYGPRWDKAAGEMRKIYPALFKKQGVKIIIEPADVSKIDAAKVLAAISGGADAVAFTVEAGKKEEHVVDGMSEQDADRMSYEEQLDSLKTGMKLLMSNATNALFLGGRGGTGKTQTVEDMLHAAGMKDGEGYYKVTGSATPTGIYRLLFQNKKSILLFDDSDSALVDQEGRNLFKAASDTKKARKISWMKGGKNFVAPEDYDEESDDDTLPRSFEFTGKIIFISNLPLNKLDPDGALRTRGYVINIDPTNEEIYDFMDKIADKINLDVNYPLSKRDRMEVVDILRARKIGDKTANLRSLVRGLNTRAGVELSGGSSEEWKKFVKMFA